MGRQARCGEPSRPERRWALRSLPIRLSDDCFHDNPYSTRAMLVVSRLRQIAPTVGRVQDLPKLLDQSALPGLGLR